MDLWSCDGIFGPMSLQWFPLRDAVRCGLVGNLVIYDAVTLTASIATLGCLGCDTSSVHFVSAKEPQ